MMITGKSKMFPRKLKNGHGGDLKGQLARFCLLRVRNGGEKRTDSSQRNPNKTSLGATEYSHFSA